MKKIFDCVYDLIFLAAASQIQAQDTVAVKSIDSLRNLNQSAFSLGERLVYDVGYSFITAGEAVFSIPAIDTINGSPCYPGTLHSRFHSDLFLLL